MVLAMQAPSLIRIVLVEQWLCQLTSDFHIFFLISARSDKVLSYVLLRIAFCLYNGLLLRQIIVRKDFDFETWIK